MVDAISRKRSWWYTANGKKKINSSRHGIALISAFKISCILVFVKDEVSFLRKLVISCVFGEKFWKLLASDQSKVSKKVKTKYNLMSKRFWKRKYQT